MDDDGCHNHNTGHDILDIGGNRQNRQAVGQDAEDRHADDGSDDIRDAFLKQRLADEDRGERIQAKAVRTGGMSAAETGGHQGAGESGHGAGDHEGQRFAPVHVDPADACCGGVSADGVELPAEGGFLEQDPEHHGQDHHDDRQVGNIKDLARAQGGEFRRDPFEDRCAPGDPVSESVDHGAGRQGDDEGHDVEGGHDKPVHESQHR